MAGPLCGRGSSPIQVGDDETLGRTRSGPAWLDPTGPVHAIAARGQAPVQTLPVWSTMMLGGLTSRSEYALRFAATRYSKSRNQRRSARRENPPCRPQTKDSCCPETPGYRYSRAALRVPSQPPPGRFKLRVHVPCCTRNQANSGIMVRVLARPAPAGPERSFREGHLPPSPNFPSSSHA